MQMPLFDHGPELEMVSEPVLEVSMKAIDIAVIDHEIARLERKLMRLKNCAPGAFMGPSGDYKLRMIRRTENKIEKLSKKKEEILSNV